MNRFSTSYYLSSRLFPARIRRSVENLYRFVREADEYVDGEQTNHQAIDVLIAEVSTARAQTGIAVRKSVADVITLERTYQFNQSWLDAFFASMVADKQWSAPQTEQDVHTYIYGSASVIGLMMHAIMQGRADLAASAAELGTAFQLTNFCRDIREDALLRQRVYFSAERLQRYGLTANTILSGALQARTKFLQDALSETDTLYTRTLPAIYALPFRSAWAVLSAHHVYRALNRRMAQYPALVFEQRLRVPNAIKLVLIFSSFCELVWKKTANILSS